MKTKTNAKKTPAAPIAPVTVADKAAPGKLEENSPIFTIDEKTVSITFSPGIDSGHWEEAGRKLAGMQKVSAFALGDWLNFGKEHFPEGYKSAAKIVGLAEQTLRSYASIAKNFPAGQRWGALTMEHHRLLFMVKDGTQREALALRAEKEGLTAAAIRDLCKDAKPKPPAVQLTAEQMEEARRAKHILAETEHLENIKKAAEFLLQNMKECDSKLWVSRFDLIKQAEETAVKFWSDDPSQQTLPLK